MPIMRNPFRSKPNDVVHDNDTSTSRSDTREYANKADSWGTSGSSAGLRTSSGGIVESRPTEYKLSEISDNGVYLPPSPTETKSSFWSTRSGTSTRTSSHRSFLNDNEPFSISRESFDSYRRSFDICARSPVIDPLPIRPRQSLDARQMRLPGAMPGATSSNIMPRSPSLQEHRRPSATPFQPRLKVLPDNHVNLPTSQPDESDDASPQISPGAEHMSASGQTHVEHPADRFDDVGLGDPIDAGAPLKKPLSHQLPQSSKKPGLFSRFGGSTVDHGGPPASHPDGRPGSSGHGGMSLGLGMFGRKRGGSGQGAELGSIHQSRTGPSKKEHVSSTTTADIKVDS